MHRFQVLLQSWASGFAAAEGLDAEFVDLPADIHVDEATGFLRALESGIVNVDAVGRCSLPHIHRAGRKPTEPCLLSKRKTGAIYLAWREYLTQVATCGRLVLEYGWPRGLVGLDPRNWEFDVAGFASEAADAPMLVACETKKTTQELEKLLGQVLRASDCGRTLNTLEDVDGHKKYAGLLKERPSFFWAVAPGLEYAYSVSYADGAAALVEVRDLPPYDVVSNSPNKAAPDGIV